ncbi:ABC transporter ATP-binding protein [Pandoraea apista]|uniref:ABC transporter ATP-binding protein n=1 Tax=Pandoraea apista TaxID=93218 RepID=A0A5E5PBV6_9BURK|nr:ABC transporter ATP-binding protein [Pandoraea apista]OXS88488.1 ABC transporter ATP-binding protein [Pandoraea apista]PTE01946.1 ABC transporter ATP-binding protein [Pandoraea apista]RRJ32888.1 ABC transporter ATP-binding protein [Pandoraea apista]RRJ81739.1 ABC transporter ATP-binding protein [Pandoraea apista]RSD11143.1 ABC transporter ATP-binding protein [Pandoraea apista]
MSLLVVDDVSHQFGSLHAVDRVSMSIDMGELRAVIGPNGAGKTTFFNLLSGLYLPTAGRIIFKGEDVTAIPAHRRVTMGMARTFQITEVFPELSARENVRFAVEIAAHHRLDLWLPSEERRRIETRTDTLIGLAALSERCDRSVNELPLGDQRATEILMSLALNPTLLLLDEPTAGMADQETYEITQLIRKLNWEQGLSMILIEHDMRVIFELAQRITVLAEGRVLAEGTPPEIAANEQVQAAYLGAPK